MNKNKQTIINMAASLIAFAISIGINFFLSKYIVESVGAEANGFIKVSDTFLACFSVITVAMNSMAGRFISISYFRDKPQEANEYYSSTFFSNVILSAVFFPIFVFIVFNVSHILNISTPELTLDVQFLLGFTAINFLVGILSINFGVSFYIKNKLYIQSLINIAGYVLRAVLLYLMFSSLKPYVAYTAVVMLIVTLFTQGCNIFFKHRLIPELKLSVKNFRFDKVKTLFMSGIWNSITRMGTLLSSGIDLIVTNLMLGGSDMGLLALVKIIPNMVNNMTDTLSVTFIPNLTKLYAENKIPEMVRETKSSMQLMSMLISIPIGLVISFGTDIFSLWYPSEDAFFLRLLSVIAVVPLSIVCPAMVIQNIFTIINKIKTTSLLICATGFLNILVLFVLLKTTNAGISAVVCVGSVLAMTRDLCYTVPYGAKYLGVSARTFYPDVIKSFIAVFAIGAIGMIFRRIMPSVSWLNLFVFGGMAAVMGLGFNFVFILGKESKRQLIGSAKNFIAARIKNKD